MNNFRIRFLHRKRSNSTPTRQLLADYLYKSVNNEEPSLPPQNQQNASSAEYCSLPTNNSKPLLIASSFNNIITYQYDPYDSSENDETPGEHSVPNSRPPTPPSQSNHDDNNNKQQSSPPSNSMHYNTQRNYEQDEHYPPQDAQPTWHTKTAPKKIPFNQDGHSATIKRRPTPFAADHKSSYHQDYHYYDDDDDDDEEVYATAYHRDKGVETNRAISDHQISHTNGYNNDPYDAEVRKLKTEIKRLEKKHKEHEQHILDTQQQLENLIISRSYESTFFSGGAPRYPPFNVDSHHYHSQSLNERQQHQPQQASYRYTAPYDTEYYYANHPPNDSYPKKSTSKEPLDYFSLPKRNQVSKNNNSNASTSRRYEMNDNYRYGYNPPTYASSSSEMVDDENYYYQLQQRHYQLQHYQNLYHQRYSPHSKIDNNKRWSK